MTDLRPNLNLENIAELTVKHKLLLEEGQTKGEKFLNKGNKKHCRQINRPQIFAKTSETCSIKIPLKSGVLACFSFFFILPCAI